MHDLTASQKLWYVTKKVLASPVSLALWAVGGVISYYLVTRGGHLNVVTLSPVFLAAAVQIGLLYTKLHDEEYLRRLFQNRQQKEENLSEAQVESLLEQMDFETRQRIRYILQLQKEVAREARGNDVASFARGDLERVAAQLAPLVQRAVRIAIRKQQLSKYLHNIDEKALTTYCSNLRQKIASTTDSVTKSQYEQALKSREAELQTYQAITQAADRIDSQLENVEATFASWKAKVIRIKTADVASAASVSEGLHQELDDLTSEIDLLDTSVSEALAGDDQAVIQQGLGN